MAELYSMITFVCLMPARTSSQQKSKHSLVFKESSLTLASMNSRGVKSYDSDDNVHLDDDV